MSWLVYALAAALCWGLSVTLFKKSYNSLTPITAVLLGAAACLAILLPFSLLNSAQLIWIPLVPVATIVAAGYIFYFYALDKGKLGLVAPVQSTYPLFTIILATIFLQESISLVAKGGVIAIIGGLIAMSTEDFRSFVKTRPGAWLWWGLGAAIFAGVGDFLGKVMVSDYDPYTYTLSFVVGWIIVAVVLAAFDRNNITVLRRNKDSLYILLAEAFMFFGYIAFFLAFKDGLASIVTPISAAYGLIALLLAVVWLKEKMNLVQLIGAVVTITGVIAVSAQ